MSALFRESHGEPTELTTAGGVVVRRTATAVDPHDSIEAIVDELDSTRGVLLASNYEFPGRYSRWDIGFTAPPLQITARARDFEVAALNERGKALLPVIAADLRGLDALERLEEGPETLAGRTKAPTERFAEEERSKQSSIFSVLRRLLALFRTTEDSNLGLYGAFGYDLAFQFEPIDFKLRRPDDQRDLVLYVPDEITVVDRARDAATRYSYELEADGVSTAGLARDAERVPYGGGGEISTRREYPRGEYARMVGLAKEWFKRGDLFEVVPGQTFYESCKVAPSELFRRMRDRNPAPYGALINLGEGEYLVSASPEMFVRVEGRRVETCPISGTIARGDDVVGDSKRIVELLQSEKQTAELTMCTDVDRNDKSRICVPGSVRIVGRRQIELYSRVIHTVDHVEGELRDGFDGLDAFLSHAWAVTVTGAPKLWAMRFIEEHEASPRRWYGGALGRLAFNGNVNTGLTLRTVRISNGVAEIRAGGTLLFDSVPEEEEQETEMKAAAFIDAVRDGHQEDAPALEGPTIEGRRAGEGKRVLLLDHEDSFVHTLANYLRQTGADVTTLRIESGEAAGSAPVAETIQRWRPDLVVLSPGPGTPDDFRLRDTIGTCLDLGTPLFGVCLGLQGIVEYYGGKLGILPYPMHGKESKIFVRGGGLFAGVPDDFAAGRYHSLYAEPDDLPADLLVTAESEDGVIMAVEHRSEPVAAVQFHPESLMTLEGGIGLKLIQNAIDYLTGVAVGSRTGD